MNFNIISNNDLQEVKIINVDNFEENFSASKLIDDLI